MKSLFPKIVLLCLGLLLACSGQASIPSATPPSMPTPALEPTAVPPPAGASGKIDLPRDEGIHLAPVEWWYFNGHLEDGEGNQYSYHFVNFVTVTPDGLMPQLLQLGWADHSQDRYITDEKPTLAAVLEKTRGDFDFHLGGWAMSGDGSDYRLAFDTDDYAIRLAAVSRKPAVLHQKTGLVDLGQAGKTFYYSRTRLDVSGTLTHGGTTKGVTGQAWMDHQWGDFSVIPVGWDWTSIQLDDGAELMLSLVWDAETKKPITNYGTYIPRSDQAGPQTIGFPSPIHLSTDDIQWSHLAEWTSPATGVRYPMDWELTVDSLALALNLTPRLEGSEFADSLYAPTAYWEGAVTVMGTRGGEAIKGRGFVELVGYEQRPRPGSGSGSDN